MSQRAKCPHCGKVVDFHNDFCTECWSHVKKGRVLSPEQISSSRETYAGIVARKKWDKEFERWQKLVMGPAVLLTIASIGWTVLTLPFALSGEFPWFWMLLPGISLVGFALGGYLIGGCKALPASSVLLGLAALAYGYSGVESLLLELSKPRVSPGAAIKDIGSIVLCGMALVGAVQIFRLRSPDDKPLKTT